jgi:hypothetical protein
MATSATIALDRACPVGGVTINAASAQLSAMPSNAKNVLAIYNIPFNNAGIAPTQVPVVFVRTLPVHTDYTAYPIGTEIRRFVDSGTAITGFELYFKIANAGAAGDIAKVTQVALT